MAQVLGPRDEVTQTIPAVYVKVRESKGGDSTAHFSETLEKEEFDEIVGLKKTVAEHSQN